MDPLTQGLCGAIAAQLVAKKKHLGLATLAGVVAGMAPDLDIFIRSTSDSLLAIQYHRHFTHALAFIPIGALLVSCFLWFGLRNKISFKKLYLYCFAGFATHGALDACTSYGTLLYWPFIDERISWDIISIIDPIFTIPLLICVTVAALTKRHLYVYAGSSLALGYLMLGLIQQHSVSTAMEQLASERGHIIEDYKLNPTLGNIVLWRSVYKSGDFYYVQAIRHWPSSPPIITDGEVVPVFSLHKTYPNVGNNSVLANDIHRFAQFSQEFIYQPSNSNNLLADLRYGILPHSTHSLWGIYYDPEQPNTHADFTSLKRPNNEDLDQLIAMIKGEVP